MPEWGRVSQAEIDAAVAVETTARQAAITAEEVARDAAIAVHAALFGLHTLVVRKAADEFVTNSTVFQNDDELLLAIAANEVWLVRCHILSYDDTNTNAGLKFQLSLPSGASSKFIGITLTGTTAGNVVNDNVADGTVSYAGTTVSRIFDASFIVINGATAGNVVLQWAQYSGQTPQKTYVKANSCLIATKLA